MGKRKRDMGWDTLPPDVHQASIFTGDYYEFYLQPCRARLDNADKFDDWYHDAVQQLRTMKLHRFIDKNFPRPARSDHDADNWYKTSRYIQKWLAASISQELNQNIAALGKRIRLADEFMQQVKNALQVQSPHATLSRVHEFEAIKLSGYPSELEYIQAVKVKFSRMYTIAPIMSPYYALMRILDQIDETQYDILHDAIHTLAMRKHNSLVDKFTLTDFQRYCTRMIKEIGGDSDDDEEDEDDEDDENDD